MIIFKANNDDVTGDMRMAHNKGRHDLYSFTSYYPNEQTKKAEMDGTYRTHERRNMYTDSVWKPEGKISLGKPRCR